MLNCGIVGLPNVGKSTIFSSLTSAKAEAANYPFCTIEPNVGIVSVPDKRLGMITEYIVPQKVIPAVVEFVDIAGLVKGASKGEGLGNKFLGHIRQVGAIIHVVRCFDDDDVVHVEGKVDPISDIETISIELALADLETVQKRQENIVKFLKSQDKKISDNAKAVKPILELVSNALENGSPANSVDLDERQIELIADLHLITMKSQLYCCNVSEDDIGDDNEYVKKVRDYAQKDGSSVVVISGQLESEIATLDTEEEKADFLEAAGLEESGLDKLIRKGYEILGLKTYFTAGEKEVRAWTFPKASKAPQAAGVIHSDFEKGFIRAETYHCTDLFEFKSEQKLKENGKIRLEGKDYEVDDGDVLHFRFNV
ncbi:MAG: redox-regulated ATPase YchF [Desulfobacterales bacterium]|nr:redox-regulated ATPase YchF [Desulfobacterales bacterium]MCP4159707.1 redox-regulated ATPase YchF [Deltaproteobacteria bacterium]